MSRLLLLGIALAAVQLAVVVYAVDADRQGAVMLLYMAIPAALTVGWAYARRDDRLLPVNVLVAIGVATALQVVVYTAFHLGEWPVTLLPAALLVGMVFLMAVWSGRGL